MKHKKGPRRSGMIIVKQIKKETKREIEHQRRFEEALNWESNNTLFDYMDEDDQ